MHDPDPTRAIESLLGQVDARLRRRRVLGYGAVGLWAGAGLTLLAVGLSRLWWPLPVDAGWLALAAVPLGLAAGLVAGAAWPGLTRRELALVTDRLYGTDELIVTTLFVRDLEESPWTRQEVLERAARRVPSLAPARQVVRAPVPRHGLGALGLVAAAALLLLLPQAAPGQRIRSDASPVALEGERLEERLEALGEEFEVELPTELEQDLEDLVRDLKRDRLTEEEAVERLDELAQQLDELDQQLMDQGDVLRDLQEAAEQLAAESQAQRLADALQGGDLAGAGQAARDLADALDSATPEERQRAGEALERAGERLARSEDQGAQGAGEALQRAGQQLQQGGGEQGQQGGQQQGSQQQGGQQQGGQQQGGQQQGGQQQGGQQQGGQGGTDELRSMAEELQRNEQLAQQLQQQRQQLEQSQRTNGALEGARQRLGGEPKVSEGQCDGGGQPGQGGAQPGQGGGSAGVAQGAPVAQAGTGHTWEDEGTSASAGVHQDADRTSRREGGEFANDFEQLYAPVRLDGAQGLVAGTGSSLDDRGQFEFIPTRKAGGELDATAPLIDAPDGYREAADRALETERIPPGYREAVKQYFDGME